MEERVKPVRSYKTTSKIQVCLQRPHSFTRLINPVEVSKLFLQNAGSSKTSQVFGRGRFVLKPFEGLVGALKS
jgi:hypothetical protein